MRYEELDMRTWDRQETPGWDRAPDWDMGHQNWTGATGRGHTRGQEPLSHPPASFIHYSHQENCPHPTPCVTRPGTCCDPPGKLGYFLEGGFRFTFPPSRKNCCPHVALLLDLGPFLAKMLHFPGKIPLGGAGGVLEPQRNDGFPSFPHQDLGSSTVLPGERKLMGFKHMKEKGLEKHSPLFFKERS